MKKKTHNLPGTDNTYELGIGKFRTVYLPADKGLMDLIEQSLLHGQTVILTKTKIVSILTPRTLKK